MTSPLAISAKRPPLPKITIVTPSYHQAEYLEACMLSVLSQGYPNLEYIVMDGGSTDGSADIIQRHATRLSYWQSCPDGGQVRAINAGFARGTGEIMAWLNSDDMLQPYALWKVAAMFGQHPELEWLTGRSAIWEGDGRLAWIAPELPQLSRRKHLELNFDNPFIQQDSTFWRRSLWQRAGGQVDPALRLTFDTELWLRFFRRARLHILDSLLSGYRITGANLAVLNHDELCMRAAQHVLAERALAAEDRAPRSPLPRVLRLARREVVALARDFGLERAPAWGRGWERYFWGLTGLIKGNYADGQHEVVQFIADELELFDGQVLENLEEARAARDGVLPRVVECARLNDEGAVLLAAGQAREALARFERALGKCPNESDTRTLANCAAAVAALGHDDDAERHARGALELAPMNKSAALCLHALYTRAGRPDDAARVVEEFARFDPDEPEMAALRARAPRVVTSRQAKLPRITIVTPSYNQGRYLEECIQSVLAQGYPNLEYIVMDGGSTDASIEILRRHATELSYWQSAEDGGHASALNAGFARSTGDVMGWLNSDDKLHPGALWKMAWAFQQHPELDWLTGRPSGWDSEGMLTGVAVEVPYYARTKHLELGFGQPFIKQESTYWRRRLWDQAGGKVEPAHRLAFDTELWLRFFRHARLHVLDALVAGYRVTGENVGVLRRDELVRETTALIRDERRTRPEAEIAEDGLPRVLALSRPKLLEFMRKSDVTPQIPWGNCWPAYFAKLAEEMRNQHHNGRLGLVRFVASEHALYEGRDLEGVAKLAEELARAMANAAEIDRANDEGEAHFEAGRNDEAVTAFARALKLSPGTKETRTLTNGARACARAGRVHEAEQCFRVALVLEPMHRPAVLGLHRLLVELGQHEEAARVVDEFSRLDPDDPEIALLRPPRTR